jgi:four helix bundle protein
MNDLRERTRAFALRIIRLAEALPSSLAARVIGGQVIRSGTSVGAQYREASRSRSNAEMISKIDSVLQELDETSYWLELLGEAKIVRAGRLEPLHQEANELTAIFVTIVKKLKARKQR